MPLGDLASTYLSLLITNPQVHWHFLYIVDDQGFDFDDQPVKECLEDVSLTEPDVLAFLRETIQSGVKDLQTPGCF